MKPCRYHYILLVLCMTCLLISSCKEKKEQPDVLFEALGANITGLNFSNTVTPTEEFNMFKYMYFYNGGGIGAGDFNNDGKIDLFFSANQSNNKLYLNEGNLHFKNVSEQAAIPTDKAWSTGVSVVDINNDGLLDIYVCRVGNFEIFKSKNQLLVCKEIKNGIPFYKDEAAAYGLDFSGFSTQAAFLDYDLDGDLDMYLLNHSIHQNSSFADRKNYVNTYSELSGDRLYKNNGNHFTDATRECKINSSQIGYGLGIAVGDINVDGWPDIYIGNDFHENDYLYINQQNGTFTDESKTRLQHTSKFSMGVDIADINNDAFPEIISMDMLAADPYILKRSLGDDDYDVFYSKIAAGYNYQYSRNTLQYNRDNGVFSETGLYSGIAATDWSWAPLWMDFDNDGNKDLFISNGIPKRLNDMDYINFIYNNEIQEKLQNNDMKDKDIALMNKFPEIKIPNKFYSNNGNLIFTDKESNIKNNAATYSNGAVYADFDNDGDLDVVVNNINDPALFYENKTVVDTAKKFIQVKLLGDTMNRNAVGTKIILFSANAVSTYEKNTARGFMSSMETPLHIGLGQTKVDSAFLIWPDNSVQKIEVGTVQSLTAVYKKGLPKYNYQQLINFKQRSINAVVDITSATGINYIHKENSYNEFDREPLMPHMLSTEGPALAVADINDDGLDDIFAGASKTFHNAVYVQQPGGIFKQVQQPDLFRDSMYEDVDAVWADINNDDKKDLIIASGGNEFYGKDEHLLPRVYINDGKGILTKLPNAVTNTYVTAACIAVTDFNGDGFADIFLGGRTMPWNYGAIPNSYLLQNDGTGKFTDVTAKYAPDLSNAGMVTNAVWTDIDKDGDADLLISCQWGGITAFVNNKKTFTKNELTNKKGWWNFVLPFDADGDGDMDLIAGNMGLNTRLQASVDEPVRLYFNDFDDNGKKEQILTYYLQHREITFSGKDEIQRQIPLIKKKFIYAGDFAKASLYDIFSAEKMNTSVVSTADYFENAILVNNGNFNFTIQALPWQAQLTAYRDAVIVNANNDNLPDIFLAGNYYSNNIHNGRFDADYGTVLINKGKGEFNCEMIKGIQFSGETRQMLPVTLNGLQAFAAARNNDTLKIYRFSK
jgi:enediyne biosynthesis protein E4